MKTNGFSRCRNGAAGARFPKFVRRFLGGRFFFRKFASAGTPAPRGGQGAAPPPPPFRKCAPDFWFSRKSGDFALCFVPGNREIHKST